MPAHFAFSCYDVVLSPNYTIDPDLLAEGRCERFGTFPKGPSSFSPKAVFKLHLAPGVFVFRNKHRIEEKTHQQGDAKSVTERVPHRRNASKGLGLIRLFSPEQG